MREPQPGRLTRGMRLERVLADLQRDIECRGSLEDKRQRRAILRGMRLAVWLLVDARPSVNEVHQELRAELFGCALPSLSNRVDDAEAGVACE